MAGNVTLRKDDKPDDDDAKALNDKVAAIVRRLDDLVKRHEDARRPDDDRRDSPISSEQAATLIELLQRHLGEGEIEEGEEGAADDDDTRRKDKELPRQTASDDDAADDDRTATAQHRADSVATLHGARADRPRIGESSFAYRIRSARQIQRLLRDNDPLRHADLRLVTDRQAFAEIEDKIYENAKQAAYDPAHVQPGTLREVVEIDRSGRRISRWVGDVAVTLQPFRSPPQRARVIRPPGRPYND